MELRELAEFEVRNRLLGVPGVAAVEVLGGYLRQFQVQLDPERMAALGVTLNEVLTAARRSNENAAGGFVTQGSIEWTVRAVGRAANVGDLRATVVAVRENTPVLLGDVAEVREAPAVRRGMAHRLGWRGRQLPGGQAVRGGHGGGRRAACAPRWRTSPAACRAGVRVRVVYDQAELVGSALGGVGRAVLLGAAAGGGRPLPAAGQPARGADRHPDAAALDRPRRPDPEAGRHRPQHHDPRRARHRRRACWWTPRSS